MSSLILSVLIVTATTFLCCVLLSWQPTRKRILRNILAKKIYGYMLGQAVCKFNRIMKSYKEKLFNSIGENDLSGFVLEIGAGGGSNLEFYPRGTQLVALEPDEYYKEYLTQHIKRFHGVSLHQYIIGKAENMEKVPNNSMSCVVSTLVLCSVESIDKTLAEIKRVLRPGGRFYFLEHTVAFDEESWVFWIQHKIQPVWRFFSGCSITSKTWENIENAGFSYVEIEKFVPPLPRYMFVEKQNIIGYAIK